MTHPTRASGWRRPVRACAQRVRRVVAPAALELREEVGGLRDELAVLRRELVEERARAQAQDAASTTEVAVLREELAEVRRRAEEAEGRTAELATEVALLRDGLHESRRLNLRTAELVDLVTELVLPLHDRDVDAAVLATLRGDVL